MGSGGRERGAGGRERGDNVKSIEARFPEAPPGRGLGWVR